MRKFIFAFLTLVTVLSLGGATFAQTSSDDMPCLGLEQEDCDLYYDLAEPDVPESASFTSDNNFSVTAEGQTYDGSINLSGSYIYDVSVVEDYIDSIADVPLIDATLGDFIGYLESGIDAFDAELSIVINAPDQFAMFIPMETISADLWLVEGDAYADLTPIGQVTGDPSFAGVYGIDLFEFVYFALEEVTLGDLADALGEIEPGDLDFDAEDWEEFQRQFQANMQASMTNPEDVAEFVNVTRLDDEQIDGVDVAVFETTMDFQALFGSDLVLESIEMQTSPEDFEAMGVTPEELLEALQASIGDDATFVSIERYGLEDGYLYNSETEMSFTIDPTPFMELDGMDTSEEGMEVPDPVTIEFQSTFNRTDFDAVEEIVLPDGAQIVPLEELMDDGVDTEL